MLKAKMRSGLFVLGLDAETTRRLKEDQPVVVSLDNGIDVLIVYGETSEAIKKSLEESTGEKIAASSILSRCSVQPEGEPYEHN
jgi:hypothetical protein